MMREQLGKTDTSFLLRNSTNSLQYKYLCVQIFGHKLHFISIQCEISKGILVFINSTGMQTTLLTCKFNDKDTCFIFTFRLQVSMALGKQEENQHPQSCSSASLSLTTTASNGRSKIKAQGMDIILELFKYREAK